MKVGDLVQRKRRGWLAIILKVYKKNKSVEIMWLNPGNHKNKFDSCSMSLLEVINENR
jgi:hypothetical protein